MSENIEIKDGWTLKDALEKCSDFALLTAFRNAENKLRVEQEKMPDIGQSPNWVTTPTDVYNALKFERDRAIQRKNRHLKPFVQAFIKAEKSLIMDFFKKLKAGQFLTWGCRGSRLDGWSAIPVDAWNALKIIDWRGSVIKEFGRPERINHVRVFPPLMAPDAPERISGLSLAEAFKTFVLNDPELLAAVDALKDENGRLHPVHERQFVRGCYGMNDCAIGVTRKYRAIGILTGQKKEALHGKAWQLLGTRISRLVELLNNNSLVAIGEHAATGEMRSVNSFWWARDDIWVDFTRGDLFKREIVDDSGLSAIYEDKPEPVFRGLKLTIPEKRALDLRKEHKSEAKLYSLIVDEIRETISDPIAYFNTRGVKANWSTEFLEKHPELDYKLASVERTLRDVLKDLKPDSIPD